MSASALTLWEASFLDVRGGAKITPCLFNFFVEETLYNSNVPTCVCMCRCSTRQVDDAAPVSETVDGVTDGSGEGFNTLAGYLFGNNTREVAMDMTTPVNIDVSPTGGRWVSNHVLTTMASTA